MWHTVVMDIHKLKVDDHQLLLRRLQYQAGVVGDALNWMESYLENRSQQVLINGIRSSPIGLKFGIPNQCR